MRRILSTLLIAAGLLASSVMAITAKIEPQSTDCFKEIVPGRTVVNVAFAVTHGGKLDLDVTVNAYFVEKRGIETTRKHRILNEWKVASEGHSEFTAPATPEPSIVEICFDNRMSRWTPKWVNLEFYKLLPQNDDGVTGEHNAEFRQIEDS